MHSLEIVQWNSTRRDHPGYPGRVSGSGLVILYEVDEVIAGGEDLLKIETLALRKRKIEEDERLIYDNLGNIVVIELIKEDNETIESDNDLEMMEDEVSTATSPTPFTRTQPMGLRQDR